MRNVASHVLDDTLRAGRPLLETGSKSLTTKDMHSSAAGVAQALTNRGLHPGAVVGLAFRDPVEVLTTLLGAWICDITVCVIDFRTPAVTRSKLAETFGFDLLLADRALGPQDAPCVVDNLVPEPVEAPQLTAIPDPTAPALISLTSGTTGAPAGSIVSHAAILARAQTLRQTVAAPMYGRLLSASPLSYMAGLGPVVVALIGGGTVLPMPPVLRASDLHAAFVDRQATGLAAVPTLLRDLMAHCREGAGPLGVQGARPIIVIHGAPSSESELTQMLREVTPNLVQIYGASPVAAIACHALGARPDKRGTVGQLLPGIELQILDADGTQVPVGETGIFRVRTPGMADSMVGREKAAGADYIEDGWYYSGDMGAVDAEGYLTLTGRGGDVIKQGGVLIYPGEVEAVLRAAPGVLDAAVLGVPAPRTGEDVGAVVRLEPGATLDAVTTYVSAHLTADKRPRQMIAAAAIPLNRNGKADRAALRALFG